MAPEERERALATVREAANAHGVQAIARKARLSRQHVAMILKGRARPTNAIMARLAGAAVAVNAAAAEAEQVMNMVRQECARIGLRAFARLAGIDDGLLARVLAGSRRPSATVLATLRRALRMDATPPAGRDADTAGSAKPQPDRTPAPSGCRNPVTSATIHSVANP